MGHQRQPSHRTKEADAHYSFHILDPDWAHITIKISELRLIVDALDDKHQFQLQSGGGWKRSRHRRVVTFYD